MALTIGEANAVNTLIYFITNRVRPGSRHVTPIEALEAANLLAQKADKALMAGFKGNGDLDKIWPPSVRGKHLHGELRGKTDLHGHVTVRQIPEWSDVDELLQEIVDRGWAKWVDEKTLWIS